MWISEQLSKESSEPVIQLGRSVINDNGAVDIASTGVSRDIKLYSPYGYAYSLPSGKSVLTARNGSSQAAIGIELDSSGLESGEIRITASSGAYIHLKNDGSVIINGLKITKNGVIE